MPQCRWVQTEGETHALRSPLRERVEGRVLGDRQVQGRGARDERVLRRLRSRTPKKTSSERRGYGTPRPLDTNAPDWRTARRVEGIGFPAPPLLRMAAYATARSSPEARSQRER